MTIGAYLRMSLDASGVGVGVKRQRPDCAALSALKFPGVPIKYYEDNDVSAYSGARRPQYEQLISDIIAGEVTAIVAWNLDRLLRQPRELERLIDLNVPVITAAGDLDLTTHDGQLQGRILAAVAKKSSDDTSRRVKRARLDMSEQGRWIGGKVSYPYHQQNCTVTFRSPVSRDVARHACELFLEGRSIRHITATCSSLDATAPRTDRGWRGVLVCPALAGVNTAGVRGDWEAVLTAVEHATILSTLNDPARRHARIIEGRYWLTGIVVCQKCEINMYPSYETRVAVKSGARTPVVRCPRCGGTVVRAHLDAAVTGLLLGAALPSSAAPVHSAPAHDDRSERLSELAELYMKGDLPREAFDRARSLVAEHRPVSPAPHSADPLPDDLAMAWPGLPTHRRHQIARRYFLRVEIATAPSNGGHFDSARVVPIWRG